MVRAVLVVSRYPGQPNRLGTLLEPRDDWHVPGAALPDGGFALLRADAATPPAGIEPAVNA